MKYLILLLLTLNIFSKDLVNWKSYKNNINKPVFMLLTDNINDKNDKKVFSNKRLAKLLNKDFYSIKIDVNKDIEFKNRYLLMTPPSIAILTKTGIIITKKRNYTPLTIERDLYNYLESLKNKSFKEMLEPTSKRAMYEIYYPAYFLENSKELIDRTKEIEDFMIKEMNFNKMYFNVSYMKPLYDYSFSILNTNSDSYQKLMVIAHIDSLLQGLIFNKDHIFKASYNNWSNPIKKIIYKDNIKLLNILLKANYRNRALMIDHFLYENYKKMNIQDKLLYKSVVANNLTKNEPSDLRNLIENNKNSKYLEIQIAIFKAYLSVYRFDNSIKPEIIKFIDNLEKEFYNEKKGIFYDVKKGKEPFHFKYVNITDNIELAYLYTKLYKITGDFNNLIISKYILSFMNTTSLDNLIYSKYFIAVKDLLKEEKKIMNLNKIIK